MGEKLVKDIWGVIGEIAEYQLTTSMKKGLITRDHFDRLMYGRPLAELVRDHRGHLTDDAGALEVCNVLARLGGFSFYEVALNLVLHAISDAPEQPTAPTAPTMPTMPELPTAA